MTKTDWATYPAPGWLDRLVKKTERVRDFADDGPDCRGICDTCGTDGVVNWYRDAMCWLCKTCRSEGRKRVKVKDG